MATMNISLPDKLKQWVESKVGSGDYASASDCVRDLVRRRMEFETKLASLREAILEGDRSGPAEPVDLDSIVAEVRGGKRKRSAVG